MSRRLKLADDLALPADEAVTQKYGFIGRSGSGKSYAAMRLAELFLDQGAQIIALDWVGIWWSLRLAADGKTPAFQHVYIFGGEHADVDLRPESGALMADLVVDRHISVVLDVMHFRKADRTRFATAFAEQFFHRKKTNRTACHLFIEEAQAYLPQLVRGDEARMVGVFEDLGKVGRNYGIGNSLISQRPQAINKDVLNQVEVLLAFQTNGPQERKAIAGWTAENTDAGAAMMQELPKLHVGDALVWSPQWLRVAKQVHISARETYDASSTPTARAKTIKPKVLGEADLAQLGEQIAATIERAKAEDPRELRKRIGELERELRVSAARTEGVQKATATKTVEKLVLKDGQLKRAEALVAQIDRLADKYSGFEEDLRVTAKEIRDAIAKTAAPAPPPRAPAVAPALPRQAPRRHTAVIDKPRDVAASDGDLAPVDQRILNGLAELEAIGVTQPERVLVALMANYAHPKSTGFQKALGRLRTAGHVAYPTDGTIALTAAGRSIAAAVDPPTSNEELHERIERIIEPVAWRVLRGAIAAYPDPIDRVELAKQAKYEHPKSTGFQKALGRIRSMGFVSYPADGQVQAQPVLFPFA